MIDKTSETLQDQINAVGEKTNLEKFYNYFQGEDNSYSRQQQLRRWEKVSELKSEIEKYKSSLKEILNEQVKVEAELAVKQTGEHQELIDKQKVLLRQQSKKLEHQQKLRRKCQRENFTRAAGGHRKNAFKTT